MEILLTKQDSNYWAIEYLALLGNETPTQKQIDLIKMLMAKIAIEQKISFDHRLSEQEKNCLLLATFGKTTEQTAKLLNLKQNTVKKYDCISCAN
jgi:DNA-binding NarL/FixJ family response regulator